MLSSYCVDAGHMIADGLAMLLGIPTPGRAWVAFAVQCRTETANGTVFTDPNNPLNLRPRPDIYGPWPGQTGVVDTQSGPFAAFGTPQAGAWACADNYASETYGDVQAAFRLGDPVALAGAIQTSPWDAGHYAGTLADEVRTELGLAIVGEDLPMTVSREFYAEQIEPFVKETIRLLDQLELGPAIEAELTARLAAIPGVDISGLADAVTRRVETDIAAKLSR